MTLQCVCHDILSLQYSPLTVLCWGSEHSWPAASANPLSVLTSAKASVRRMRSTHIDRVILKCAVTTANQWLGPSSLLFLATDSPLVKHLAVTKYGGRFRSLDNTLLHIDRMENYPHDLLQNETEGMHLPVSRISDQL